MKRDMYGVGLRAGRWMISTLAVPICAAALFVSTTVRAQIDYSGPVSGWGSWGNTAGGLRYSPLNQITPANVGKQHVAWTYHMARPTQ